MGHLTVIMPFKLCCQPKESLAVSDFCRICGIRCYQREYNEEMIGIVEGLSIGGNNTIGTEI